MNEAKDDLRRDRDALVRELTAAGVKMTGTKCRCPWHDDRSPSAGIHFDRDGVWRFHCHGPCQWRGDVFDVRARVNGTSAKAELREAVGPRDKPTGRRPAKVYPTLKAMCDAIAHQAGGEIEATYPYRSEDGERDLMVVVRIRRPDGKKEFRQGRPQGDGWVQQRPEVAPLFMLRHIVTADVVVVCEGEKASTALWKAICSPSVAQASGERWTVTTSSGGANNAHVTDWTPLSGKRRVILWPDYDPVNPKTHRREGEHHMRQVADILAKLPNPPEQILILDPSGLAMIPTGQEPDGEDAYEYLELFPNASPADLRDLCINVLNLARPISPSSGVEKRLRDTIAGRNRNLPFGRHRQLTSLVRALQPETCTLVCGGPGSGKSFFVTDLLIDWLSRGLRPACLMCEKTADFHLMRCLAQLAAAPQVLDNEWVEANGEIVMRLYDAHRPHLDQLATVIHTPPIDKPLNYKYVLDWLDAQADAADFLLVDPITKVVKDSERTDLEDHRFMVGVDTLLQRKRSRVILVTHPVKGTGGKKGPTGAEAAAGGAAFERFCDSMLTFQVHEKAQKRFLTGPHGGFWASQRRFLKALKSRNGPGDKCELAMFLDPETLRFAEQGLVDKERGHAKPETTVDDAIAEQAAERAPQPDPDSLMEGF